MSKGIKLDEYDFFGFDLDHTICEYNLKKLITNSFNYMTTYLTREKNYRGLNHPLSARDINFITRGLFVDLQRGNLLKTSDKGMVLKASHGTRALSYNEICRTYGTERRFKQVLNVIGNKLHEDRNPITKMFSAMDFSDAALTLVFAKAIDSNPNYEIEQVWRDVAHSLTSMYTDSANWNVGIKEEMIHPTSRSVIGWLQQLKNIGYTAIITSSSPEAANRTATAALGHDWKSLFDFCVYNVQKPEFFYSKNPFRALSWQVDIQKYPETKFNLEGHYVGGSYYKIEKVLQNRIGRKPNAIYFGDSPLFDLIHSSTDRVAIIAETKAEGKFQGKQRHADFLKSTFWGSVFNESKVPTFMGNVIMNTNFCAPDLQYFTDFPLNYTHVPFWK